MNDLPIRILSALVLILATIFVAGYGPQWLFFSIHTAVLLAMTWELLSMLGNAMHTGWRLVPILAALTWNVLYYFPDAATPAAYLGLIALFAAAMANRSPIPMRLQALQTSIFAAIYPAVFWKPLLSLHALPNGHLYVGHLLVTNYATDVGAYFGGKLLGRRRLSPALSPKKTWEGLVAGMLLAAALSWLFMRFVHVSTLALPAESGLIARAFAVFGALDGFDHMTALALGAIVAVVGQISDLSESLIKRACSAKDSGALIPGHGGLLDRCDSLLFNAPLLYYFWYRIG